MWFKKGNEVTVDNRCLVSFSIGKKYFDNIWCDIVVMDACYLLLGRPWQYVHKAIHDDRTNTYTFWEDNMKITLATMKETDLPKPISKKDIRLFTLKPFME